MSGGDLFILDFILEKMETARDIDAWKEEQGRQELYQKAIDTYFKGERRSFGKILGLLVLAQFDIGIHPEYYGNIYISILQESMKKILDGLVVTAGTPARCYFLHSSLAELLCRAAGQEQRVGYIETVTRFTLEYFKYLVKANVDTLELNRFLVKLILGKLKIGVDADEEKKDLLLQWERKVSPAHYLRLIVANGTIFELIMFLKHSTVARAGELIDALSDDVLQELIGNTIASGRSIGTLDLGLRELQIKCLLEQWERKVSPAHYLRLIAANGTIVELVYILQYSTKPMARNLIQYISREWTDEVIKNTNAKKPSLNPLPWGIKRLLRLTGNDPRLFDEKIGLDNLFHLIINSGNPGIFIQILDILPKSSQETLIESYQKLPAEKRTDFIIQGNFYHFCTAVAHYPQLIISPGETGPNLNELGPIIIQLIESSDFLSINSGISCLEEIIHPGFKALVLEQVSRRFELLPLEKANFTSNTEKVNYLALLNRLEKLDSDVLHRVVPTINRKAYIEEKYFFSSPADAGGAAGLFETPAHQPPCYLYFDFSNGYLTSLPGKHYEKMHVCYRLFFSKRGGVFPAQAGIY